MSATATREQAERAELEAVLRSGIFNRSPILATFLRYICERHFEGDRDGLKEYCIAVEALKRPPVFDQKKDAIVRVEAHRLRKRLADYYLAEGIDHAIQIEIPSGQYAPRFVSRNPQLSDVTQALPAADSHVESLSAIEVPSAEPPDSSLPAISAEKPAPNQAAKRRQGVALLWIGLGVAALIAITWIVLRSTHYVNESSTASTVQETWVGPSTPVPSEFRILAGYRGQPFTDRQGRTWLRDAYYKGGVSVAVPSQGGFQGLPDPRFARSQRVGDFEYSVPVNPGTYEVHLYFMDTQADTADGPGVKLFNVSVNGKLVLDHIDPLSDAGAPRRMTSRVLGDVVPYQDGRIHLKFEQEGTRPELLALEVLATGRGTVRPVRIVAATRSATDLQGQVWLADEYAVGGTLIERRNNVPKSGLEPLYTGERYGNFSYHIPLAPGRYRIRLYFVESYFTDAHPPGTPQHGFSARVFNVFADGVTLLRNFNVMKEAGGPHLPVVRTFEGLEPNAQGKIVLEFVPVVNYAEVNAIEVTQMNESGM